MKAEELDELFDRGEDITRHLDVAARVRPGRQQQRFSVDLPEWMIDALDLEAVRVDVTRQSIIKMWIAERIDAEVVKRALDLYVGSVIRPAKLSLARRNAIPPYMASGARTDSNGQSIFALSRMWRIVPRHSCRTARPEQSLAA